MLAFNLLFSILAISLVGQLMAAYLRNTYIKAPEDQTIFLTGPANWFVTAAGWVPLLLGMLLAGVWYYMARRGKLWAEFIVLALFLRNAYSSASI